MASIRALLGIGLLLGLLGPARAGADCVGAGISISQGDRSAVARGERRSIEITGTGWFDGCNDVVTGPSCSKQEPPRAVGPISLEAVKPRPQVRQRLMQGREVGEIMSLGTTTTDAEGTFLAEVSLAELKPGRWILIARSTDPAMNPQVSIRSLEVGR